MTPYHLLEIREYIYKPNNSYHLHHCCPGPTGSSLFWIRDIPPCSSLALLQPILNSDARIILLKSKVVHKKPQWLPIFLSICTTLRPILHCYICNHLVLVSALLTLPHPFWSSQCSKTHQAFYCLRTLYLFFFLSLEICLWPSTLLFAHLCELF